MNCDCIKDIEGKMANFIKPKAGENATAKIQGRSMQLVDAGLRYVLTIPFRIKGSGKGYTSEKGKEVSCNASYCPFCGRTTGRYSIGEDNGINEVMKVAI